MKYKRHSKILELINSFEIYTQEELAEKLSESGFITTQATISRDIKELKLLKIPGNGGQYKYASGSRSDDEKTDAKFYNILAETVISISTAKNLIVVKTYSGMAQAAAAAVDAINFAEVIGSIAGDDTVLLVFMDDINAESVAQKLNKIVNK
jgi:transcriptional regulator of arginine metabolism